MTRLPGLPSLRTALRASTSFVLALRAAGASTLTPATAPALTGTYPDSTLGARQSGSITGAMTTEDDHMAKRVLLLG